MTASESHIAEWVLWMRAGGTAATTIELRAYYVGRLAREHPRRDITTLQSRDLVRWVGSQQWAPATRSSARTALRCFYTWAADPNAGGLLDASPAEWLPRVRVPRAVAKPTPEQHYRRAVETADDRVKLAVMLAGQCGLRRGELARAHTNDVLKVRGMWALRVHGKGGNERLVPLPDPLAEKLRRWPSGWLFPSPQGGHMTPHHVGKLVSKALGREGGTTHGLRHRCATVAYQGTTDLRAVQTLLGHQRPETTAGYVATDLDSVRAAMLAAAA